MQRETAMPLRLGQIIFAVMLAASPISAGAQVTIPTGGGGDSAAKLELTSPEAIREIISRMSDTEVREVLLERLDAVAAEAADREATADGGLLDFANRATVGVFKSVVHAISKTPLLIDYQSKSFATFFERLGASGIFFLCVVMAAAIAAGLIIEQIFYRVTRRWTNVAPVDGERSLRETIVFLFKRFLSDIAGVVVFYLAASTLGPLIGFNLAPVILGEGAPEIMPVIGDYIDGIWFNLIILPRLSIAATRFLISPSKPEYRLITTDDWSARFLHRHQAIFIFLVGFSAWIVTFNDMNGVPMGESRLGFWLNVAVHGYFAAMLWRAREGLTTMMRGADPDVTPGEERAAHYYPYIIVGITIAAWFMVEIIITYELWSLLAGAPQVKMFILLAYAPVMDAMVRGLVRHLTPPMTGEGVVAERAYLSAKRSYIRIGRIIAFAIVVVAIGQIWGIDFTNLATAGVGAQFAGRFIEILVVLALGYLFWELVSLWINRRLAAEQTAAGFDLTEEEPGGGEGGGIGGSRLSTVLPLLLGVMKVAIGFDFRPDCAWQYRHRHYAAARRRGHHRSRRRVRRAEAGRRRCLRHLLSGRRRLPHRRIRRSRGHHGHGGENLYPFHAAAPSQRSGAHDPLW